MFYDVLQKLVFRAFKTQHNKRKARENMVKLKVLNIWLGKAKNDNDLEMQANELDNLKKDFMIDFHDDRLKSIEDNRSQVELI